MKLFTYLFSIAALFALWACTEDPYSPDAEITPALKFVTTGQDSIRTRYAIGKQYLLKIKLINEFTDFDSVTVFGYYQSKNNDTAVTDTIKFRNDGLAPDQIPNNDIWTATFTPSWDNLNNTIEDSLILKAQVYTGSSIIKSAYHKNITCQLSFPPVLQSITGLASGTTLESGFEPYNVVIKGYDENNINNYTDNLKAYIEIYDSLDTFKRMDSTTNYIYDSTRFNFRIDSTYAAGLKTSSLYKIRMYIKDSFGDLSDTIKFSGVKIKNTKPVISNIICDTIVTITNGSHTDFFISFNFDDFQGKNDINPDSTGMYVTRIDTIPNINKGFVPFYNDGTQGDVTGNDFIYSRRFVSDTSKPQKFTYKFSVQDKAGNKSIPVIKTVVFQLPPPTKFKGKK